MKIDGTTILCRAVHVRFTTGNRLHYQLDLQKQPIYLLFAIIIPSQKYFRTNGYAKTFSSRPDEEQLRILGRF